MIDQLTKLTDTITNSITNTVTDAVEKLPKVAFSDIKLPTFGCSNVELPTLDLSELKLPDVKLPTSEDVEKLADLYRDIAYAGIGAWVVAIQKVDNGVRSIADRTPVTTDAAKETSR